MTFRSVSLAALVLLQSHLLFAQTQPKTKGKQTPQAAMQEMKKMLGTVPTMFNYLPEAAIPGAWEVLKTVQISRDTAIPNKYKELIGAAVAAQIPCHYCSYFHQKVSTELNQASQAEFKEAVAEAALTRHWSTVLNGVNQEPAAFRKELNRMFKKEATPPQAGATTPPDEISSTTSPADEPESAKTAPMMSVAKTADDVYRESQRLWGFVPTFIRSYPKEGIAGAWNEYVALEMNPNSAIPMKYKSLISLAVAAQIPCEYCVMMDKRRAQASGASANEINEAIAMASIVRHWSTVLNGNLVDQSEFNSNTDQIISFVKAKAPQTGTSSSTTSGATEPSAEPSAEPSSEAGTTQESDSGSRQK